MSIRLPSIRMLTLWIGVASVVCLLPTSCIGYSNTGHILGTLEAVGGPAGSSPKFLPGTVHVVGRGNDYTYEIPPAAVGSFYASVPNGSYTVTGRSPLYQAGLVDCLSSTAPVTVQANDTVFIDVVCVER